MSVNTTVIPRYRVWNYDQVDKGLPSGVWYCQGAVIGDASAGRASVFVTLNAAGPTRSGRMWSLEQWMPTYSTDITGRVVRVLTLNTDVFGVGLGEPIQKALSLTMVSLPIVAAPSQAAIFDESHGFFIGSQAASVSDAQLRFDVTNINTAVFGVYATGYEWGPGAVNAPGGLRRPPGGVL